jgi:hypothetical protein
MRNKWFIKQLLSCVVFPACMFFLAVLILGFTVSGFAKMYEEPKSFSLKDQSMEQVQLKILPKVDVEPLLAEDRARGKDPEHPGPYRFAVAIDVAFTLDNSGTWRTLADGRLWRLRIQSEGAKSLNLGITRFDMPKGAKLWIYDPGHTHVEGPYTSRHRSHRGSLWTPIIEGDEIVVEVFVPAGVSQPSVEIGKVNHGYRGFEKAGFYGSEGTCNNDVICPEGDPWRDQIRAVGLYHGVGIWYCTGTLLNNTALPRKPYFLSANHCGVSSNNDDSVVVYWNYQSANCNVPFNVPSRFTGSLTDNQTGAIFRASYAPSDFVLFELKTKPDPSFNVFYAGWDVGITKPPPPSTVGIHHPAADVKAISFSNSAPQITSHVTDPPRKFHWRVVWDSGVTEMGSSGSCLFDANTKRCIGQLHGGGSSCQDTNSPDYYGRLSVSWIGGGTRATRLKNWLDSGNTGILFLNGHR